MDTLEKDLIEIWEAISGRDYERALRLIRPLAEQEVAGAIGLLGVMYQLGTGVEQNGKRAVELLMRGVQLGDGVSAHHLSTLYDTGLPGVAPDAEKSKHYQRKAKEMGVNW